MAALTPVNRDIIMKNVLDPVSGKLMTRAVTLVPCGHTVNEDTLQHLFEQFVCPYDNRPIKRIPAFAAVPGYLTTPITLSCGHSFKQEEIANLLSDRNKSCPHDGQLIEKYIPNFTIKQLADLVSNVPIDDIVDTITLEAMPDAVILDPCGHTFSEETARICLQRQKCIIDERVPTGYFPDHMMRALTEVVNLVEKTTVKSVIELTEEQLVEKGKEMLEKRNFRQAFEFFKEATNLNPFNEVTKLDFQICRTAYLQSLLRPDQRLFLAMTTSWGLVIRSKDLN